MKILQFLFFVLLIGNAIIFQGCGLESGSHCFAASTPVDIEIQNTNDKELKVILLEFKQDDGFKRIGKLKIKPFQHKTICLEYEGPISKGLYIYANNSLSKISLSQTELNRFNVNDRRYRIKLPAEVEEIVR